jgi:glucosamine-6-phosphate deaminase
MIKPEKTFKKDKLNVEIYNDEKAMGMAAADFTALRLKNALESRGAANLILATGTSQFAFLEALKEKDIDWAKITVFHLDEYTGISEDHPASFRKYLKERILNIVKPGKVYLIDGDSSELPEMMSGYEKLLKENPVDIACIGIGENGHIAFNDPPVADFKDPLWVKEVELDHECRVQQLEEGWFPSLDKVPERAVTLTVTAIMNSKSISCVVPGKRKIKAVNDTLNAPVNEKCPATILRRHPDVTLFLDMVSGSGQ